MSTNKILLKFAKKGINLSPEAYNKVINAENPLNFASTLIVKLKSDKFTSKDLVSVSGETIDEILGKKSTPKTEGQTPSVEKEVGKAPEVKKTQKTVDETPQVTEDIEKSPKKPISIDTLKKESDKPEKHVNEVIEEASETIKDTKIKFKRNEQKSNVEYDFQEGLNLETTPKSLISMMEWKA